MVQEALWLNGRSKLKKIKAEWGRQKKEKTMTITITLENATALIKENKILKMREKEIENAILSGEKLTPALEKELKKVTDKRVAILKAFHVFKADHYLVDGEPRLAYVFGGFTFDAATGERVSGKFEFNGVHKEIKDYPLPRKGFKRVTPFIRPGLGEKNGNIFAKYWDLDTDIYSIRDKDCVYVVYPERQLVMIDRGGFSKRHYSTLKNKTLCKKLLRLAAEDLEQLGE